MRTAKTDQTGRMPRLIRVFARRTLILLVLLCRSSYGELKKVSFNHYQILTLSISPKLCMYFTNRHLVSTATLPCMSMVVFDFLFGFYGPSRLYHSVSDGPIARWGANGRSSRKSTWTPASRTKLVSRDSSSAQTHSSEMTSHLER